MLEMRERESMAGGVCVLEDVGTARLRTAGEIFPAVVT
jgi:hypothetical protein